MAQHYNKNMDGKFPVIFNQRYRCRDGSEAVTKLNERMQENKISYEEFTVKMDLDFIM